MGLQYVERIRLCHRRHGVRDASNAAAVNELSQRSLCSSHERVQMGFHVGAGGGPAEGMSGRVYRWTALLCPAIAAAVDTSATQATGPAMLQGRQLPWVWPRERPTDLHGPFGVLHGWCEALLHAVLY